MFNNTILAPSWPLTTNTLIYSSILPFLLRSFITSTIQIILHFPTKITNKYLNLILTLTLFRFDQPTSNANLTSTFERILFMSLFRNITIFLHHSTRSSPELATPETRRSNSSPGTFVTNPMEIFTGRGKSVKWKSTSARGQVAGGGPLEKQHSVVSLDPLKLG